MRAPTFYLYTRLNENQTKSLRKAGSNRDEKRVLATVFGLKGLYGLAPGVTPNKVEQLKLDFHYMNYTFCKEHQFSNEQTSTLLAVFDDVLIKMLNQAMTADQGLALLK